MKKVAKSASQGNPTLPRLPAIIEIPNERAAEAISTRATVLPLKLARADASHPKALNQVDREQGLTPSQNEARCPPPGLPARGVKPCSVQRERRSSTRPSGPRSVTSSGIWPKAWVEQDRQGSKARITPSTRLSMPSSSRSPLTKRLAT